ncbi:SET domain-containing protein [Pontiella sulfatireligans]|uniref:SET domain-containing protein n=1 Tax=Pontiella sulfatireligans TaxID=2750658 RepID=A0A6C2ULH9_9BACT|nr:SET domain-containing protein-lysine N-methyltransferase [Pontiella sulfatireligans]VGO21105.1 hypothetical protein SCARR_03175 [Pontiella sulfatireligans]
MPNMHKLEVRNSRIDGQGVFAVDRIAAGEKIGTYHGKRTQEDSTYVLWVTDLDGVEYGVNGHSDLKFLNHSARPNAEFDGEELHALVNIKPGDEVTFHYGKDFVAWLQEQA